MFTPKSFKPVACMGLPVTLPNRPFGSLGQKAQGYKLPVTNPNPKGVHARDGKNIHGASSPGIPTPKRLGNQFVRRIVRVQVKTFGLKSVLNIPTKWWFEETPMSFGKPSKCIHPWYQVFCGSLIGTITLVLKWMTVPNPK